MLWTCLLRSTRLVDVGLCRSSVVATLIGKQTLGPFRHFVQVWHFTDHAANVANGGRHANGAQTDGHRYPPIRICNCRLMGTGSAQKISSLRQHAADPLGVKSTAKELLNEYGRTPMT